MSKCSFTIIQDRSVLWWVIQCTIFPHDRISHKNIMMIFCKSYTLDEILYLNLLFAMCIKESRDQVHSCQFLTVRVTLFLLVHAVWECREKHSHTDSTSRSISVGRGSGSTAPAGYLVIEMLRFHPRWQTVAPAADGRWWNVILQIEICWNQSRWVSSLQCVQFTTN
jgi:hypothetical protein